MAILRELLETRKIVPVIARTCPLGAAREALRHMIDGGPQGKVILIPEGEAPGE